MLLTLTTTYEPATDLGYLLHKNPSRMQTEELSFGKAHILYPEASNNRCTAAVLIEVDAATIERQPLWNNRRGEHGPFDIVGDVHGCLDELLEVMSQLGYTVEREAGEFKVTSPVGRTLVFVGDLVDRGPASPDVLRLVMTMVDAGQAICVPGNHDIKLVKALKGRDVQLTHGLAESIEQLRAESDEFRARAMKFLDGLVSHYVFDDGKLVVAHAGLKESMQGRGSAKARDFTLYGETTGETDEFGLPVRYDWSADYRGKALVVYGHTPVPEPQWLNNTVNIDTGCVFGGRLTALRYPEREIVSVPAHATYYQSRKPFLPSEVLAECASQHVADDVLDIEDVTGKRIVDTRLQPRISIREENAMAALEVMSRFAVDPKWLIYLPPTMSPTETTRMPGHDGFIVPNCFEEFYERFPNYVATWVRKRVRGCVLRPRRKTGRKSF